jgi:hypothetical protein
MTRCFSFGVHVMCQILGQVGLQKSLVISMCVVAKLKGLAPDNSYRCRISRGRTCGDLSHGQAVCGLFNLLIITKRTDPLTRTGRGRELIDRGATVHTEF